jgi:hypothetical protein
MQFHWQEKEYDLMALHEFSGSLILLADATLLFY